jgi:hypothetical protein
VTLLDQTLLFYLVVGLATAGAVYLSDLVRRPGERWLLIVGATLFWPMYVPVLLARRGAAASPPAQAPAKDALDLAISQVDTELAAALAGLDGWASHVLARERDRLTELRGAWTTQAARVREIDRLLSQPETEGSPLARNNERIRQSEEARRQNMERLRRVRQKTYDDLVATLARVRELVSLIHLAKFTGQPAARAEELVAQIAAAVEGVAEIMGEEESPARPESELAHIDAHDGVANPRRDGAK